MHAVDPEDVPAALSPFDELIAAAHSDNPPYGGTTLGTCVVTGLPAHNGNSTVYRRTRVCDAATVRRVVFRMDKYERPNDLPEWNPEQRWYLIPKMPVPDSARARSRKWLYATLPGIYRLEQRVV